MLKDDSEKIELFIMFNSGRTFITETLEQIELLVTMLDDLQNDENRSIKWRAITTSIIIFLSNLLEGYANFLITLVINIDNGKLKAPKVNRKLSETEFLALTECSKIFDTATGKEIMREKAFMRTSDKLRIAPFMLEILYNPNATLIDRSTKEFQQLTNLLAIRDSFMHIKHDINLLPQNPVLKFEYHNDNYVNISNSQVSNKDIFNSTNAVAWYLHKQFVLVRRLFHVDKLSLDLMELELMHLQIFINKVLRVRNEKRFNADLYAHIEESQQEFIVGAEDDNCGLMIHRNECEKVT